MSFNSDSRFPLGPPYYPTRLYPLPSSAYPPLNRFTNTAYGFPTRIQGVVNKPSSHYFTVGNKIEPSFYSSSKPGLASTFFGTGESVKNVSGGKKRRKRRS